MSEWQLEFKGFGIDGVRWMTSGLKPGDISKHLTRGEFGYRWKHSDGTAQPARTDDEGRLLPPETAMQCQAREVGEGVKRALDGFQRAAQKAVEDMQPRLKALHATTAHTGKGLTPPREVGAPEHCINVDVVLDRIKRDIDKVCMGGHRVEKVLLSPRFKSALLRERSEMVWSNAKYSTIYGHRFEVDPTQGGHYEVRIMRPNTPNIDPDGNALRDIDEGEVVVMDVGTLINLPDTPAGCQTRKGALNDHSHIRAQLVDGLPGEWHLAAHRHDGRWHMGIEDGFIAVIIPDENGASGWVISACGRDDYQELPHTHVTASAFDDCDQGDHVMRCAQLLAPKVEAVRAMVEAVRDGD